MGKMKELNAMGVSDLMSYNLGKQDEQERIVKLLEELRDFAKAMGHPTDVLSAGIGRIKGGLNETK
jgi:hypothetical protein